MHQRSEILKQLTRSRHGLEVECLRVSSEGKLSQKPHPKALGAKLTHPYISTDFGEAQLELISPPCSSEEEAVRFIEELKAFVLKKTPEETLWPYSAPTLVKSDEEVQIAEFGDSEKGWEKRVYRQGLANRFSKRLQAYSGIHYNFSFAEELWPLLGFQSASEGYFHLIRNFLREGWLLTYLFGASPSAAFPGSTSLRMSPYGYYSKVQEQSRISFNSLENYLRDLRTATTTPSPEYEKIPLYEKGQWQQLNKCILQIEAEHYSRIRPKARPGDARPLEALAEGGVGYIEIRALDLQPAAAASVSSEDLRFIHAFLLACLLRESPPLTPDEESTIVSWQNRIAVEGRLFKEEVQEQARFMGEVFEAAKLLDEAHAGELYQRAFQRIANRRLPCEEMDRVAEETLTLSEEREQELDALALKSWKNLEELEWRDDFIYRGYEELHPSTQCLLREAQRRGCEILALDRSAHFFRLKRGDVVQDVKDASMTSADTLISYFAMENKKVTKHLLEEAGILTPQGFSVEKGEEAKAPSYRCVVKPNLANYGLGIHFVEPGDEASFQAALKDAFTFSETVLVEEFCPGEEVRFLIVGEESVAACKRIPANVLGDGKQTIAQLTEEKNSDPYKYKLPQYRIRLGEVEKAFLKQQGLTEVSIPHEAESVYLRQNSNVSTGGDSIDVTEEMPEKFHQIARSAAKAVGAEICGVDMLIEGEKAVVIECNFNPALWIHRYPTYGKKRTVERKILDKIGLHR